MNPSRHTADPVARLSAVDTSRLPDDGGPDFNRLIFEKSPYLLQHAANPVDWYPWAEEVFARARQEDKPVFLSIGYSTCHWCHVMAHESFENQEVADLLRRHYFAIKVDREERPDIDSTYMTACHMMTGSGGWPLTLVLTPERQPFFAATYLPTQSRQGAIGLIPLLQRIARLWEEDRERLTTGGHQLTEALRSRGESGTRAGALSPAPLREALRQYLDRFDRRYAGFGEAPKFPAPHNLALLLRLGRRFDDRGASTMALQTLRAMRLGGIYDQVGFGLHRYAVDERWRIPHFEKMLYDQALLILAAVAAWQVGGEPFFAQIARETSSYLMRDLRDPQGAFYCGEDADSEGAEGTFYLWTPQQVEDVLGRELATVYCRSFGITAEGNFEGRSIPHLGEDVATLAERAGVAGTELALALETARQRLFEVRERRPRPHRDDKILTAWNGLAVAALARAGAVLGVPELVTAAAAAADFIADRLRTPEGRLLRRWRDGEAAILGFLEDYAFFGWGLLELHQARFRPEDLALAVELTRDMERLFGDGAGGLLDSGGDAEQVLGRGRSLQDGAIPSGTSVAIGNLLRLGRLCGDTGMEERGRQLLRLSLPEIERYPSAYAQALCGLDFALGPVLELALVPGRDGSPPTALLEAAREGFQPRLLLAATTGDIDSPHPLPPSLAERRPQDAPSAHLCRDRACLPPVTDPGELKQQLA